ncbi:MAG: ABC transporter permease [Chloroflexi bacterium]|nr:ABC transporter permease [Chloroflexota bacterium]
MLTQVFAIAVRVLRQLAHDRRFVALSLIVPFFIIWMLNIFFDAVEFPVFRPKQFIVPAAAFIVHFLTYVLCAIVLVRERTAQTLARMFVNGYQRSSIITGYILAYSLLATLQSLIVLISIQVFFELDYAPETMLAIYGVFWLLALISIALGIFVSNFARNEGQVFPFIPLMTMPSVFFSGMIVPVSQMPDWAGFLSTFTPLYYAIEGLHALTDNGGDLAMLWGLPPYGLIVLTLATLTLREQE